MSLASVSRMEAKLLLPTYERQPILFVRGRGSISGIPRASAIWISSVESESMRSATITLPSRRRSSVRPAVDPYFQFFFHEYQAELAQRLTKSPGLTALSSATAAPRPGRERSSLRAPLRR